MFYVVSAWDNARKANTYDSNLFTEKEEEEGFSIRLLLVKHKWGWGRGKKSASLSIISPVDLFPQ